uniref:Uncharacterized protein n=1 Tax=Physcomitrium patens TaxID=3218 RepID=A0A2K1KB55_PHYPA|nr:hypothetical protein PHYPA_010194 [Physcomitrium patens]
MERADTFLTKSETSARSCCHIIISRQYRCHIIISRPVNNSIIIFIFFCFISLVVQLQHPSMLAFQRDQPLFQIDPESVAVGKQWTSIEGGEGGVGGEISYDAMQRKACVTSCGHQRRSRMTKP